MNRTKLLESVSTQIGRTVRPHHLYNAQRRGYVSKAPKAGGWQQFTKLHIDQLAQYMKQASRDLESYRAKEHS